MQRGLGQTTGIYSDFLLPKKYKQRKVSLNMWGGKKFFWQQIEGLSALDGEIQLLFAVIEREELQLVSIVREFLLR